MRSSVGAADDRSVGDVLAEKRGDVWAVVGEFGFTPGLCAVRPSLLGVRRADRDVEGGVRVAKGGGEDVGGSEVSAKNEAGNLGLCSAIAGLGRCVYQRSNRVVVVRDAQQMAWAAPVSRDSVWQHRAQVHRVWRSPGAGEPSQRAPQAPTQLHDAV